MTNKLPFLIKEAFKYLAKLVLKKPETQSHFSESSYPIEITLPKAGHTELSPEVKEAMEELKNLLLSDPRERPFVEVFLDLTNKSDNLLNALDKQFKVNKIQSITLPKAEDLKSERVYVMNSTFETVCINGKELKSNETMTISREPTIQIKVNETSESVYIKEGDVNRKLWCRTCGADFDDSESGEQIITMKKS